VRTLQCVPGSAYPAVTKPGCVPCSAYPAVTKPGCVRAYPAVRHRMVPAVPARVRVRVVRTRQSSNLGAYPAVAPVRTRQCPPCSPKDGPRGLYAPPLLSTTFSQAKGHIRQAIHGFLGSLVGKARAAESWVRTLQWTHEDMEKKNLHPPRRRQPTPPPRPPPLGRLLSEAEGPRRPPVERKRGGCPSSPGTFADAQTRRPPPPAPRVPRSPARALDPAKVTRIPLLGPPRRRAQVGNLGEEGLTLSRS